MTNRIRRIIPNPTLGVKFSLYEGHGSEIKETLKWESRVDETVRT